MKNYLAMYIGTDDADARGKWDALPETDRQARQASGMQAWAEWVQANAASIVDHGSPLGKTKRASRQGITDTENLLVAYIIVRAESHEAATKLFEDHPHFSIFPGDSVEVMECLPLPGAP